MKDPDFFGPVKLKDKSDQETWYRRVRGGEWQERHTRQGLWNSAREIPDSVLRLAAEHDHMLRQESRPRDKEQEKSSNRRGGFRLLLGSWVQTGRR